MSFKLLVDIIAPRTVTPTYVWKDEEGQGYHCQTGLQESKMMLDCFRAAVAQPGGGHPTTTISAKRPDPVQLPYGNGCPELHPRAVLIIKHHCNQTTVCRCIPLANFMIPQQAVFNVYRICQAYARLPRHMPNI